jgi:hypothetical protein
MKKLNHLTLAEGEATLHHHTITKGEAELYEDTINNNRIMLLQTKSDSVLTHQEHNPVTIPKKKKDEFYEVGRVQEWDEFEQESRQVQD